jgi:hypothetical protein
MCSVSWSRGGGRLVVVMNRDERRDRPAARPPRRWPGAAGGFVAPVDAAAGGTWIAARRDGLVVALLNHHPARRAAAGGAAVPPRISRGGVVTALVAEAGVPDAARLRGLGLTGFAPFRLFAIGPRTPPRVFTWDGDRLVSRRLDPRCGFLTSSSWSPASVLPARHARFRAFRRAHPWPTRAHLSALHADTTAARGTAWAICMARDDARTVSTTSVEVRPRGVSMRYLSR